MSVWKVGMMLFQESVWADTDMWKAARRLLFRDRQGIPGKAWLMLAWIHWIGYNETTKSREKGIIIE